MKMNLSAPFVGLLLASAAVLQGCVSSYGGDKKKKHNATEAETDEEGTAQCMGGNFSCSGNWRSWCDKMEKKCTGAPSYQSNDASSCTPKCTWECETQKCEQTCAPKCGQAMCSTRCKGFNTQNCHMQCGKPNCKVVCPKHFCPGKDCAACKTECGKPQCHMQCAATKEEQPCHHVCAQPQCKWECKKPQECPKPQCHMKCEKPRDCLENTRMVQQLPALEPGESEVTFGAASQDTGAAPSPAAAVPAPMPKSLLQSFTSAMEGQASTMRVEITTMGQDHSVKKGEVDLPVAPMQAVETVPVTWTRTAKKHHGMVTESEASCNFGNFQCRGDAAWCTQQRQDTVCEGSQTAVAAQALQSAEAAEYALQPSRSMDIAETSDAVVDAEAEEAASQALRSAKLDAAFMQRRAGKQGRMQA